MAAIRMVRALYTLRWQIERLFKPFQSMLQVHQSHTGNAQRLRCELDSKLIAAVVVHRMHAVANTALWHAARREISMDTLSKRIQERACNLAQRFVLSLAHLDRERATLLKHCRKYRQRSRMTTRDMLEAGFDPKLQTNKCQCLA